MDDIKLISLVESQEILYNKKRSDYKDRNKQCNAWQTIADSLKQDVEQVKARWLCLRQRFSRERSKLASGAAATDEWELLKYMRFLDGIVAVRKTMSNYKKPLQETSEALQPLQVYIAEFDDDVGMDSCGTPSGTSVDIFTPTSGEMLPREVEIMSPTPGTSKDDVGLVATPRSNPKKRSAKWTAEEPPQKQMLSTLETTLQGMNTLMAKKQESPADSDEIFGQFVASRLKLLDDAEKKEKIKEICNILLS